MDIWMFMHVIAIGPIKECRKLVSCLQSGDSAPTNVFANFNLKKSDTNSSGTDGSANNNQPDINLTRICAEKVLSLYEENKLQHSDISNMPVELLQKIVSCIPMIVPSTETDVVFNRFGTKLVRPPAKLNFDKQEQFIKRINELRSDLPSNWADEVNNRLGVVMYNYDRSALHYTDPKASLVIYNENNIELSVLGRVSCDWDQLQNNHFSKIFVLENRKVAFTRKDLPQEVREDDHALIKKYGHLLQGWREVHDDKRMEFDTTEFGVFQLVATDRVDI